MASPYVLLCVAHTLTDPGAVTPGGMTEHAFSARACDVAAGLIEDAGFRAKIVSGPRATKIKAANAKGADFAALVEPHFNASLSPVTRGYQAIYAASSQEGKRLARCCCNSMRDGFAALRYNAARWIGPSPVPGPLVRHDDLPLLTKTRPPAVITEYAFATNACDVAWIERPTGAEEYGVMVAAGVIDFLKGGGR